MFDLLFKKPNKKVLKKDGKKLLLDFDKLSIEQPKKNDIIIKEEKLKEVDKSKKTKKIIPKKGKSLF